MNFIFKNQIIFTKKKFERFFNMPLKRTNQEAFPYDNCFRINSEVKIASFRFKCANDTHISRYLDQNHIDKNWRDSNDAFKGDLIYKGNKISNGNIDWRKIFSRSGEYKRNKKGRFFYSGWDIVLAMLACSNVNGWNKTERQLAKVMYPEFSKLYFEYTGQSTSRTLSSFHTQCQILLKFQKENKLDERLIVIQEKTEELEEKSEELQDELIEQERQHNEKKNKMKEEFEKRCADLESEHKKYKLEKQQEMNSIWNEVRTLKDEYKERLHANEQKTEELKEETRQLREELNEEKDKKEKAENSCAYAQSTCSTLIGNFGSILPGVVASTNTILNLQNTEDGRKMLENSGPHGRAAIQFVTQNTDIQRLLQ